MRIFSVDEIRERHQIAGEFEAAAEAANTAYWKLLDEGVSDDEAWQIYRLAEAAAHDKYIAAMERLLKGIPAE